MSIPLTSTKHFRLANEIRAQVRSMRAGEAIPTIEELKSKFAASQVTVEKALQRLRKEGLIHRVGGTRRLVVAEVCDPARRRVAIIRPDWPSTGYDQMVRSVATASRPRDWALNLVNYRSLHTLDLNRAVGDNDGAILVVTSESWPDHLKNSLRTPRHPVVVLQDPAREMPVPATRIDDPRVGQLAVEHLASLGHRDIAILFNQPPTTSGLDRIDGWRNAMRSLRVGNVEELLLDCYLRPHQDSREAAYERFKAFLATDHPRFTAVFCTSDAGAVAVLRVLRETGLRVPQDVSVIAYAGENKLGPYVNPPLTTIEVDMDAYGTATVDMLEERISTPDAAVHQVVISPYLVVRESTGAARLG
jgi:DNA-binding LacI/PurR family transcriptional regulator